MSTRAFHTFISIIMIIFIFTPNSMAFQLDPVGTAAERKFAKREGITIKAEVFIGENASHNFSEPVHEGLTQKIFGCDSGWEYCADPDLEYAGPYVIAGVRWNDDPPFMLRRGEGGFRCNTDFTVSFVTQTYCWLKLFKGAEKRTTLDPEYFLTPGRGNYMTRSHFGDLQFVHSMAGREGESPRETQNKILMWAEFVWGVGNGTYSLETPVRSIKIDGWEQHFNSGHNVQDLFTLGRPWLRAHIRMVAFGSLLHLVQDSFAAGHVTRKEPVHGQLADGRPICGLIEQFHSYTGQNHTLHSKADSAASAERHLIQSNPDVVDVGRQLLQFFEAHGTPWSEVRAYLEHCVFPLAPEAALAGPGEYFTK